MDVMTTLEAALSMWDEIGEAGLQEFYHDFYIKPFYHALVMEWDGVAIDMERREKVKEEQTLKAKELQGRVDATLGKSLNVRSSVQLKQLLYDERGYQVRRDRKTRKATANKAALQYLAKKNNDPILLDILELRSVHALLSGLLAKELPPDNRIHTHYNQGGTSESRWSSVESILMGGTNLQNIARSGPARSLFLPT